MKQAFLFVFIMLETWDGLLQTVQAQAGAKGCVTDGGYALPGTACKDEWTFNGVKFTGCAETRRAIPFIGLIDSPKAPANGATMEFWCPVVVQYNSASTSTQKKWGYCNCLPGGGTNSPTTPSPTDISQRTCTSARWTKAECEAIPECQYYMEWRYAYGPSAPISSRERIGCNYKGVCNIFKSSPECLKYSICDWSTKSQCVFRTSSPTKSPTVTVIDPCINQSQDACLTIQGCQWFAPTVCSTPTGCKTYTYGCQKSTFCSFTQGILLSNQCATNPICKFDTTKRLCYLPPPTQSPTTGAPTTKSPTSLPTGPTPKPTTAFPTWNPTPLPTLKPTYNPTKNPITRSPSRLPTESPTLSPTLRPTVSPTKYPTVSPTLYPTLKPSIKPTYSPSVTPTNTPSLMPTQSPSFGSCGIDADTEQKCLSKLPANRCTWKSIKSCQGKKCEVTEYGCVPYYFCGYTQGLNPSSQCNQNSEYCSWNSATSSCEGKCDKPAMQNKRTLCEQMTVGDNKSLDGARVVRAFNSQGTGENVGGAINGYPGDLNGDGHIDWVFGSPEAGPKVADKHGTGAVYVLFGPINPSAVSIDLFNSLDGKNGVRINGTNMEDLSGSSVSFVDDFNGDGMDDLLIGAPSASTGNLVDNGEAYIVYGRKSWPGSISLNSLTQNTGVRIPGLVDDCSFGSSVSGLGDVNRDGFRDIVISARDATPPNRPRAGISYVIFGGKSFPATFDLKSLNGDNGFPIYGAKSFDFSGTAVGPAGDINGDKYKDIVIGAPWADHPTTGESGVGYAYVIFGGPKGFFTSRGIDLLTDLGADDTTVAATKYGFKIRGISYKWGQLGGSVSPRSGDVDGDGVPDLVLGAPKASPGKKDAIGEAYMIAGRASYKATIDLATDLNGTNGYRITGERGADEAGTSVAIVGDTNGDGWDDIAIGSPYSSSGDKRTAGAAYIIYGRCKKQASKTSVVSLASLSKDLGVSFYGSAAKQQLGFRVAGPGDINEDGFDDFVVSAPNADLSGGVVAGGYVYTWYKC